MSRQQAIDAMCKECIYDPANGNGTWRKQVQECSSVGCPLYPYRPVPKVSKGGEMPEGLRKYREERGYKD